MRPRYFGGMAAVVACAAIALTAAGAMAAPRHAPRAHVITIHAQPDPITAGDPVVIYGRLFGPDRLPQVTAQAVRALRQPE